LSTPKHAKKTRGLAFRAAVRGEFTSISGRNQLRHCNDRCGGRLRPVARTVIEMPRYPFGKLRQFLTAQRVRPYVL
jgi:hypothetical protein